MKPTHLACLLCPLPFSFCAFEPFWGGTSADVEMLEGQRGQRKQTSPGEGLPGVEAVGREAGGTAQESEWFYKEELL